MKSPLLLAVFVLPSFVLGCGPKKVDDAPPPVGWHGEELWSGQCYFPPDFDAVEAKEGISARALARQAALEGMISQWKGERDDGVSFKAGKITDVETVLLGDPSKIEELSRKNLEFCKQVMGAGADTASWNTWLRGLPDALTAGECMAPLVNTYFDYLDIGGSWQLNVGMCAGETAIITSTQADRFRLDEDGDWMTTAGNGVQANGDLPCTMEGCTEGMLVGRFTSDDGYEEVFAIGAEFAYTAQAHGSISVTVNDLTYYDNVWFGNGGITDHTGITVAPVE